MYLCQGTCYIHVEFTARSINKIREEYPDAPVVVHPECTHRLRKEIPHKIFILGPPENCFCGECRFMKMNTLEKAYDALLKMEPEIILPESLRKRAEAPILRMLELSR